YRAASTRASEQRLRAERDCCAPPLRGAAPAGPRFARTTLPRSERGVWGARREHPRERAKAGSEAGFIPAKRAGVWGARRERPGERAKAASEAGFIPAKRAGGLGGAPLAPPSSNDDRRLWWKRFRWPGSGGQRADLQRRDEGQLQHFLHLVHQVDLQPAPEVGRDLFQLLPVELGDDHRRDARPPGGEDLLLGAADREPV